MPPPLRGLYDSDRQQLPDQDTCEIVFLAETRSEDERIRALLGWFGSGAGPWSGFPAYELFAAQMLLEYSTPAIVAAVARQPLSDIEVEGAARLFEGVDFNRTRPEDRERLPAELRQRLLEHGTKSAIADNRTRAARAFGAHDGAAPRRQQQFGITDGP